MKKTIFIIIVVLAGAAYAATLLPLDFLQPAVERAMERALGRRVEIGPVHLAFLNGPGMALDRVTVHEDPRAGIEPFAYAETVQARLDVLALLRGRLGISNLRFDDASVNVVKPDNQPWNFQMLLAGSGTPSQAGPSTGPSIKMRGGRVNIKYSQTKSVLFFDDVDLDVSPYADHTDLRFSGVPARTDRPVRNLEHFFIRGTYQPSAAGQQLKLTAELEPSPMDAVARLFVADIFPLSGSLTANAAISGPPEKLDVKGEARLNTGAKWSYQGTLSLPDQQLQLQSAVESSVDNAHPAAAPIRIHVWDLLKVPHWEVQLEQAPIETFVGVARRLGAPLPELLSVAGQADGLIAYRGPEGIEGKFDVRDILFAQPAVPVRSTKHGGSVATEAEPRVRIAQAAVSIQHNLASFGPANVSLALAGGRAGSADVSGRYNLATWSGAELRITSKGLDLDAVNPHMLAGVPMLSRISSGTGRGSLLYATVDGKSAWTGSFDLQNAQVPLDGLAEPLEVATAAVSLKAASVDVTRLRARLGKIPVAGEYHFDPALAQPHEFRIQAGELRAQELESLFAPTLSRAGGFLSRTLRLGAPEPAPDWLAKRQASGTVSLQIAIDPGDAASDAAGDTVHRLKLDGARVAWDGAMVRMTTSAMARAFLDGAPVDGEFSVDLSAQAPQYRFAGKVTSYAFKGGHLDLDGEVDANGMGAGLLSSARAHGSFQGQSIQFTPEADFRKASGRFAFRMDGTAPLLTLSNLEAAHAAEVLRGDGATQAGGTLVLTLSGDGRAAHYEAPLFGKRPGRAAANVSANTTGTK